MKITHISIPDDFREDVINSFQNNKYFLISEPVPIYVRMASAGDKDTQSRILKYLQTHPEFARECFQKCQAASSSPGVVSREPDLRASPEFFPSTPSINVPSPTTPHEGQSHDHLQASYAEMTRSGRNSVTSELFHGMIGSLSDVFGRKVIKRQGENFSSFHESYHTDFTSFKKRHPVMRYKKRSKT